MQTISETVERRNGFGPTYGWATAAPRRRFRKSRSFVILLKYFRLYCENSSLVGYKYLVEQRSSWPERFLWVVAHMVIMCILVYMIHGVYALYLDTPMVTMVESDYYPTKYLDFPGVAICSVNRISRRFAIELAHEIANATERAYQEILDLISELGNLYDTTFRIHHDQGKKLHYILRQFFKGQYNVTDIMKRLTPRCYSMLLRCHFNGRKRECMKMFRFRKTQDGFCCVFNYVQQEDDEIEDDGGEVEHFYNISKETGHIEPVRVKNLGIENGLTVVLEPFLDDYFYTVLPVAGWKVTIFNPDDFPDTTSGGVTEILVSPLTEAYLELDAVCFYSTDDIRSFSVEKRRCVFHDEEVHQGLDETEEKQTVYTYSDCIVDCKINDVWKNCGCRPFFYPRRGVTKPKWLSVIPHESQDNNVPIKKDNNRSGSLHCQNCYPACDDTQYIVGSSRSYMDTGFYKTKLLDHVNVTNQSILHIFFPKSATIRLKQDVAYRWYELLSYIGGICGVFIGFSLVSVVELVYFAARMLRKLCCRDPWIESLPTSEEKDNRSPAVRIYWHEIGPSRGTFTVRTRIPDCI